MGTHPRAVGGLVVVAEDSQLLQRAHRYLRERENEAFEIFWYRSCSGEPLPSFFRLLPHHLPVNQWTRRTRRREFSGSDLVFRVLLTHHLPGCFRAKREQLKKIEGLLPESQGQNLAVTGIYLPSSLNSGLSKVVQEALADPRAQSPSIRTYHWADQFGETALILRILGDI